MNRRDFLALFRGLAALPLTGALPFGPFIKLPPHTEPMTDSEVEQVQREYEALPPDDKYIPAWQVVSEKEGFTAGQAVCINDDSGRLEVWNGDSAPIFGIAARDIAPGEVVMWIIGGNSKDIVTSGIARARFTY